MAKKRKTGPGDPYSDAEAERVAQAIENAYVDWANAQREPTQLNVRAQIEWAGHIMPGNGGVRRTRIELGSGMDRVRAAVQRATERRQRAEEARPAEWRKAKGWHAQLRQLVEAGDRGSKAADRAGLDIKPRTLKAWLADDQYPVRPSYQERIARAYDELKMWNVREARESAERASREAADVLLDVVKDRYGSNVRFRHIEDFRWE